jgi:phosphoribosylanthranilate isomerase
MFRIKICGVTNSDDARLVADAGADAIGLNFFSKSRRFVTPAVAKTIVAGLPANITKVGVFVNHSADEIVGIVNHVGLDCIQLHGDEHSSIISQLPATVPIVRASGSSNVQLESLAVFLGLSRMLGRTRDSVLIDAASTSEYGGTGRLADWHVIAAYRATLAEMPLILAGGLTPDNVADAIAAVRPHGVDVATGVEHEPGRKSAALILQFVDAARAALDRL